MFFTQYIKQRPTSNIIQERYIGKDSATLEIEKLFEKVKSVYSINNTDAAIKVLSQIGVIAARKFGFKEITFWLTKDKDVNAYTFIRNNEVNNLVLSPKTAYKFDTKTYTAVISFSRGAIEKLTPGELTAVLLHEIGHHFSRKVVLLNISDAMGINNRAIREIQKADSVIDYEDPKSESVFYRLLKGPLYLIKEIWFDLLFFIYWFHDLRFSSFVPLQVLSRLAEGIIRKLYPFKTYERTYDREEILSDSFATIHGYGPELVSAVSNIEEEAMDTMYGNTSPFLDGIVTWIVHMYIGSIFPTESMASPIMSVNRASAQLDVLYRELEDIDSTDEKAKMQILKDIRDIEDTYTVYTDRNVGKIAKYRWTHHYNKLIWCMRLWNSGYNVQFDYEKMKKVFG